jgi:geranylgeranyl pyrophosphate synthase
MVRASGLGEKSFAAETHRPGARAAPVLRRSPRTPKLRAMDFAAELKRRVASVERGIDSLLPPPQTRPARLHTAMRYSLEAGGKRLRPVLVLAAAELCGASEERALPAAVAIECVHTYSLIHDDLPCMDNDDLRRGRPTAHRQFDEATALLAGDALLTHAFGLLAGNYPPELAQALVAELAAAAGSQKLIGGQMEDLLAEKKADATADELEFIHRNKTAAMIEAALVMGARIAHPSEPTLATLRRAGQDLGLAFQIIDDILDVTADSATLGKTAGKDLQADKATYVKLHGLPASRRMADHLSDSARTALQTFGSGAAFLIALVDSMARRSN